MHDFKDLISGVLLISSQFRNIIEDLKKVFQILSTIHGSIVERYTLRASYRNKEKIPNMPLFSQLLSEYSTSSKAVGSRTNEWMQSRVK